MQLLLCKWCLYWNDSCIRCNKIRPYQTLHAIIKLKTHANYVMAHLIFLVENLIEKFSYNIYNQHRAMISYWHWIYKILIKKYYTRIEKSNQFVTSGFVLDLLCIFENKSNWKGFAKILFSRFITFAKTAKEKNGFELKLFGPREN